MKSVTCSLFLFIASTLSMAGQTTLHHQNASDTRLWTGMDVQASNLRSDTIDVLHYDIHLDITDITGQTLDGYTTITFTPRMNGVSEINLDLLSLIVDSVCINNAVQVFTYDDTLLKVTLPVTMNTGDTNSVTVYYQGHPVIDASNWGGFYFQSGYAYNLGVGFAANPHVYGRVWHPCFDNFVERATYTQTIGSDNGKIAYCNGVLTNDTTDGNGVRWRTWNLTDPIPSYLACVAVSNYTQVNDIYNGINGPVPVVLAALPNDTTNMKNSFVNLPQAFNAFETLYYPYQWQKVGYVLVPFNSGAMEHATAITYPRALASGSLTYQTTMAHELSHHWFGDLATCRTEQDMWLNEGWASYSEYVFLEWVYGRTQYDLGIRANHDDGVHYFHHREGWLTMNNIPTTNTYGDHVYLKGADVAHTLRGYMGDSLFFGGLNYHFSQNIFKDVDSYDFRDNLIAYSGLSYLNDFFNDWVFQPGWPHFAIDSMQSVPNGPDYDVTLYVHQKLFGAPNYYTNVPFDFAFYKNDRTYTSQRLFVSGEFDTLSVTLPYNPVLAVIDPKNLISDAETDEEKTFSVTGLQNFTAARCSVTVQNCPDTAWMRIEHHYVAPDPIQNNVNNYRISDQRYWKLTGIWPQGFVATGKFTYDGRTNGTSGGGYWLDDHLTITNGDSIILLYREDPAHDWREWPHYAKTVSGPAATSKFGYVVADSIQPGEYTFATGVSTVLISVGEEPFISNVLEVFPNPSSDFVTLQVPESVTGEFSVRVMDMEGRIVVDDQYSSHRLQLSTMEWPSGLYIAEIRQRDNILYSEKITIKHQQ